MFGFRDSVFGDDGEWSEWEDVPRAKIDPERDKYKIIENISELPNGGIMVELAKFGEPKTQANLLQPDSYKIASAEENGCRRCCTGSI